MMKLSLQSSLILLTVVIIVVAGGSQVSAAIPTAERNALIDLYNSTGGVNWTHEACPVQSQRQPIDRVDSSGARQSLQS
jgi:hypothetical protein